ncbi:hypothetical protein AVEN_60581-2-1, partial [Araneus ventricosus]
TRFQNPDETSGGEKGFCQKYDPEDPYTETGFRLPTSKRKSKSDAGKI